jgi:hypothetical protein
VWTVARSAANWSKPKETPSGLRLRRHGSSLSAPARTPCSEPVSCTCVFLTKPGRANLSCP